MADVIREIYPTAGDRNVHPNSFFQFEITSDEDIDLTQVDAYIEFGTQVDPAYPVSPDYYGSDVDKNILTTMGSPMDGTYFRVMYWNGAQIAFDPPADTLSQFTQISTKRLRIQIQFDQILGYQVPHSFRVRTANALQVTDFSIEPRPFYSPAVGDAQSTFEAYLQNTDFSTKLPECHKLRNRILKAFDSRAEILAARRIMYFVLSRNLGFPDLVTESDQIRKDFRTLVFQQVAKPTGVEDIDKALGAIGTDVIRRAHTELRSKKGIPAEWLQPVTNAMDFLRIDMTYRVRVAAQTVAVAARAVQEGYVN